MPHPTLVLVLASAVSAAGAVLAAVIPGRPAAACGGWERQCGADGGG